MELKVFGADIDSSQHAHTKVAPGNGYCPVWDDEAADFVFTFPDLACIAFIVNHEDTFGESLPVLQAVLPVGTHTDPLIRPGMAVLNRFMI